MNMSRKIVLTLLAPLVAGTLACAGQRMPPKALVDARADFQRTKDSAAMQLDPADVHEADVALQRAEQAWLDAPDDPRTVDLAVIADRKALVARSAAAGMKADEEARQATAALESIRNARLQSTQQQLGTTREQLGAAQMQLQHEEARSAEQQRKLRELSTSLEQARATIAKIAAVKDDDRGMVITLQGEVLFKTDKFDLKPAAMARLDEIAQALKGKDQPIVVCGYTDSVGTREHNLGLSQNRAQSVRDYLVSHGIPGDLVTSQGKGPDEPVSDNTSIEGRAQNRRVEIVVQPKR
jgi:outer membrane protein OmpA-like peptidoglycan-associated protein